MYQRAFLPYKNKMRLIFVLFSIVNICLANLNLTAEQLCSMGNYYHEVSSFINIIAILFNWNLMSCDSIL